MFINRQSGAVQCGPSYFPSERELADNWKRIQAELLKQKQILAIVNEVQKKHSGLVLCG